MMKVSRLYLRILFAFILVLVVAGRSFTVRPTFVSKLTTLFQLAAVTYNLGRELLDLPGWMESPLIFLTAGFTLVSGAQYIAMGFTILGGQDGEG